MCRTAENSTKRKKTSKQPTNRIFIMPKPNAIQMQTFLITVNSNKQYYSLKSVAQHCQMESGARSDLGAHNSQSVLANFCEYAH